MNYQNHTIKEIVNINNVLKLINTKCTKSAQNVILKKILVLNNNYSILG